MDNEIEKELPEAVNINTDDTIKNQETANDSSEEGTVQNPSSEIAESNKLDIYDLVQCAVSALVVGILIFIFVFRVIGVKGNSMYSTLYNGDRVVASGIFYKPEIGDVIILKSEYYDQPLVKRIIAMENQTVDIDFATGTVYVDGVAIDEPYIYEATYVDEGFDGPVTVPEGHYFVMGDNRNESNDSRSASIGFIDQREIFGKVLWVLFPSDGHNGYDWSRFGYVE